MKQASDVIEYGYDKATGKENKLEAQKQFAADQEELINVMSGKRTADTIDPLDTEGIKKASRNTLDAINRNGYRVLSEQAINDKVLDTGESEVDFGGSVKNILTSMAKEYGELEDIAIMTMHRYPLLNTRGGFVDRCFDQEYLAKQLLPCLIPIQQEQIPPAEIDYLKSWD